MDDHSSFLLLGNNLFVISYCDDSHWKSKTRTTRKAYKVQCMSYISFEWSGVLFSLSYYAKNTISNRSRHLNLFISKLRQGA